MGRFFPDLGGIADHSSDFHISPVIVELKVMLIDSGQAGLKIEGAAKEGYQT